MKEIKMQTTVVVFTVLLLFYCESVTSLIIPEDLPTVLSLIYSNIPPVKKGTDSRVGVGFRFGEHADFQILVELGPQRETEPIGNTDSKRRRQIMLEAAMRGELGPWAQSVAKYQTQLRIQKEIQDQLKLEEKLKKLKVKENQSDKTSEGGEWLTKWSKGMIESPDQQPLEENFPIQEILPNMVVKKIYTPGLDGSMKNEYMDQKVKELEKLYKPQPIVKNL